MTVTAQTTDDRVADLLRILDHNLAGENDHPSRHIGGSVYDLLHDARSLLRAQQDLIRSLDQDNDSHLAALGELLGALPEGDAKRRLGRYLDATPAGPRALVHVTVTGDALEPGDRVLRNGMWLEVTGRCATLAPDTDGLVGYAARFPDGHTEDLNWHARSAYAVMRPAGAPDTAQGGLLDVLPGRKAKRAREGATCRHCAHVAGAVGGVNFCAHCGRRFPAEALKPMSLEEFVALRSAVTGGLDVEGDEDATSTDERAALWDGLMALGRFRVMGSAGLNDDGTPAERNPYGQPNGGYAHLCLEMWTLAPENLHEFPQEAARHESGKAKLVGMARLGRQLAEARAWA